MPLFKSKPQQTDFMRFLKAFEGAGEPITVDTNDDIIVKETPSNDRRVRFHFNKDKSYKGKTIE